MAARCFIPYNIVVILSYSRLQLVLFAYKHRDTHVFRQTHTYLLSTVSKKIKMLCNANQINRSFLKGKEQEKGQQHQQINFLFVSLRFYCWHDTFFKHLFLYTHEVVSLGTTVLLIALNTLIMFFYFTRIKYYILN